MARSASVMRSRQSATAAMDAASTGGWITRASRSQARRIRSRTKALFAASDPDALAARRSTPRRYARASPARGFPVRASRSGSQRYRAGVWMYENLGTPRAVPKPAWCAKT
ncbi:hypothetical protein ASG80_03650 [Agromyces sp. Soil535]|nr:hypothetical protein ASG80_03650 [Agromyces sp. Soil535]